MADKYGIKVALPEFGVKDAKPEECSITPEFPCPKIKLKQIPAHFGVYTHTFASNPGTGVTNLKVVAHNLGYKPMHLVLFKYTDGAVSKALPLPGDWGIANQIYAHVSTTNLTISLSRSDASADLTGLSWTFKYYIFVENGA